MLVKEACRRWPAEVAVGIDAKGGGLPSKAGPNSELTAEELAARFSNAGVAAIIHTDVDRWRAGGPNVAATSALADATHIPVIASGGVVLEDLAALRAVGNIAVPLAAARSTTGVSSLVKRLLADLMLKTRYPLSRRARGPCR